MPDDLPTVDSRLNAALTAMREPPLLTRDASARIAARAVLANAPIARATTWWLRAAATITIVALSAAAVSSAWSRKATPSYTSSSDSMRDIARGATITPVVATAARPIVFELDAPDAHSVQVLGDFNQWSRNASEMQRGADGRWRMTTLLPPGRYVYAGTLSEGQD